MKASIVQVHIMKLELGFSPASRIILIERSGLEMASQNGLSFSPASRIILIERIYLISISTITSMFQSRKQDYFN